MNLREGKGELAYWILQKYQGRGYASEVLESFIEFSFRELKLRRLEALFYPDNNISKNFVKKFGFRHESTRNSEGRKMEDFYFLDKTLLTSNTK